MKPGAQNNVERGSVDSDTDSDDSDTNSVAVAEPGFGQFLMNFPYEEPPEEKKEQSRLHRIMNFPHEEASKGMRGKNQSLAITNLPYKDEQWYQKKFINLIMDFVQENCKVIGFRHENSTL